MQCSIEDCGFLECQKCPLGTKIILTWPHYKTNERVRSRPHNLLKTPAKKPKNVQKLSRARTSSWTRAGAGTLSAQSKRHLNFIFGVDVNWSNGFPECHLKGSAIRGTGAEWAPGAIHRQCQVNAAEVVIELFIYICIKFFANCAIERLKNLIHLNFRWSPNESKLISTI